MKKMINMVAVAAAFSLGGAQAEAGAVHSPWAQLKDNEVYVVPANSKRQIEAHGICKEVNNTTGTQLAIPVKWTQEWATGTESLVSKLPSGVTAANCQPYFYVLRGCAAISTAKGFCPIAAHELTLTKREVRNPAHIKARFPGLNGPSGGCRLGGGNWGDLTYHGIKNHYIANSQTWAAPYDTDKYYFGGTKWATGEVRTQHQDINLRHWPWVDEGGSMIIPNARLAKSLFKSNKNYSAFQGLEKSGFDNVGWADSSHSYCHFSIYFSRVNGIWKEPADNAITTGLQYPNYTVPSGLRTDMTAAQAAAELAANGIAAPVGTYLGYTLSGTPPTTGLNTSMTRAQAVAELRTRGLADPGGTYYGFTMVNGQREHWFSNRIRTHWYAPPPQPVTKNCTVCHHYGLAHSNDGGNNNNMSKVTFALLRFGAVPNNLTDQVINNYMLDPPPIPAGTEIHFDD